MKLPADQAELEEFMRVKGREAFVRRIERAMKRGDLSNIGGFKAAVDLGTTALVHEIQRWQKVAKSGKAGRNHGLYAYIGEMDPSVLAYFTCRFVFNGVMLRQSLAAIQLELGGAVLDERRFAHFKKQDRGAYKWVQGELKRRKIDKAAHKKAFMAKVAAHKGIELPTGDKALKLQIGLLLMELMCRTPLADFKTYRSANSVSKEVVLHEAVFKEISDFNRNRLEVSARLQPMIAKPHRWTNLDDGGYYTIPSTLVKNLHGERKAHRKLLEKADLSQVMSALNAIDATPYQINLDVLDLVKWAYSKNLTIGKLPPKDDEDLPLPPSDMPPLTGDKKVDTANRDKWLEQPGNKDRFTSWKKNKRSAHERNESHTSTRLAVACCVETAETYSHCPELYFPSQLDFRGRIYQMPILFNPQGPDYARALLKFAKGKFVEDEVALGWLMIHGANMWGYDKCSLEDRITWVQENLPKIQACAEDPKQHRWWTEADKPFSFIAWAIDFIGVIEHGLPSYIRVAMDGSCNGIQHFAALLRDPVAARAVNLADNQMPSDIYQMVADRVIERLKKYKSGKKREWARTWVAFGIDRKLTKRSVMVMPYGGKMTSTMAYVEEEFRARLAKNRTESPFGDDTAKAIGFLAIEVYEATREVVTSGKVVMAWLQEIARVAAEVEIHLKWTLPHGFVARQSYVKTEKKRVDTTLFGKQKQVRWTEATMNIDPQRSVNGISPNFVHSLDACALMMTVNKGVQHGIDSFHMVHDDYGTHAADTDKLASLLREAFVELYRDHDVLGSFRKEVLKQIPKSYHDRIPPVPDLGDFDIEEVMESDFFFA